MNPLERQKISCPDCDAEGNVERWVWSKDEEGEIFKRPHKGVCSACQGTKEVLESMERWNERLIEELEKKDKVIWEFSFIPPLFECDRKKEFMRCADCKGVKYYQESKFGYTKNEDSCRKKRIAAAEKAVGEKEKP